MTKDVFNNSVIALFGKDRGTEILVQMDKKIAIAQGTSAAPAAATNPVCPNLPLRF